MMGALLLELDLRSFGVVPFSLENELDRDETFGMRVKRGLNRRQTGAYQCAPLLGVYVLIAKVESRRGALVVASVAVR